MGKFSAKVKLNKSRKRKTSRRSSKRHSTGSYDKKSWFNRGGKPTKRSRRSKKKSKRKMFKRFFYTVLLFGAIFSFIGLILILSYVQALTEDLPSPDKPFGPKNSASEIYDRNGRLLYRVFADENSDPVDIDNVPELQKWAFLAAEDIDFYQHAGVDLTGLARCAVRNVQSGAIACGASTITQQLIKQTALTSEQRYERKIKEVILALQIERERSKDEILEMYLTIAPEGSNIYGITSAAKFYFDKDLNELNLAEMAVLASIPQDPTRLSPTKSANPELAQEKLKARQNYVLDQMQKHKDKINEAIFAKTGEENALTDEMITEAREYELVYEEPRFQIESPHFVFYAQKLLQQRGYNDGEPFTLNDLETQGYRIYTTIDSDYQQIAEEQVKKGVETWGAQFGSENASLVALNPKNGEVLAMVGSYDYFGKASPEGCTVGVDCRFEPQVNIADTLQSYGSSLKGMVYYKAIMDQTISTGSILADVPIQINNYKPKNYEGGFIGLHPARYHLSQSRNIPAIMLVNAIGVDRFIEEMQNWGYTTFNNPNGYGPSVAVGGADIKLIEHAQAYGVLANEGKLIEHEVILRIEDREGNIIYEHEAKPKQVADPRGVYLVNHMLNGKYGGPGNSWDGRDVAGKTGTSEFQRETLFATYTPEIVAVGWLGNNNNEGMRYGASGMTSAKPWVSEFLQRVGESLPATEFPRPAGIVFKYDACSTDGENGCSEYNGDLAIAEFDVEPYVKFAEIEVCKDQPDRLARDIDKQLGMSETIFAKEYIMPDESLQKFLDVWVEGKFGTNGIPEEFCDVNRNPNGSNKPWVEIGEPLNGDVITNKVTVSFSAYTQIAEVDKIEIYFENVFLGSTENTEFSDTFVIGEQSPGTYELKVEITDKAGGTGSAKVNVEVLGTIEITNPDSGESYQEGDFVNIQFDRNGTNFSKIELLVDGKVSTTCSNNLCVWNVEEDPGEYEISVRGWKSGNRVVSELITLTVKSGGGGGLGGGGFIPGL